MTVSVASNLVQTYSGDGSTVAFSYTHRFDETDELVVILRSSAGVDTVKTLTTHYTVSGAATDGGGTVTMLTAPASGETLIIYRKTEEKQVVDLANASRNDAPSVELQLDRMIRVAQDHGARLDRAVTMRPGSSGQELPEPEAGRALVGNAAADGYENKRLSDLGTLASDEFGETLLQTATKTAARKALAVPGMVNLADYGAVGDDDADNSTALANAAAALGSDGGIIFVPPGRFRFGSDWAVSGVVSLLGCGTSASELISVDGASIVYTGGAPAEFDGPQFILQTVGIKTKGAESHDVVDISFTGGEGGTGMTVIMRDVEIAAYDAGSTFNSAARLDNARNLVLDNVRILGDRDASPITSAYGILLEGDSSPVEIAIRDTRVYFVETALGGTGEFEGINLNGFVAVACQRGVDLASDLSGTARPGFHMVNSHLNTGEFGVKLDNIVQAFINDNLIYYTSADSTETAYVGIDITVQASGTRADAHVHGNTMLGFGAEPKTAIRINADSGTENVDIDGNLISAFDTGIDIGSGVSGVRIGRFNTFDSVTTKWSDGGIDTIIEYYSGSYLGLGPQETLPRKLTVSEVNATDYAGVAVINRATESNTTKKACFELRGFDTLGGEKIVGRAASEPIDENWEDADFIVYRRDGDSLVECARFKDAGQFLPVGPVTVPSFDVAGSPSASAMGAGSLIYVTNGDAGSPCLAVSNGTNWLRVALGAAISAT